MQRNPSGGLRIADTITEKHRARKLVFACAALCALLFAFSMPHFLSFAANRSAENWAHGWSEWKRGDAAGALRFWSKDMWLAAFAPRPARLCYWRARALDEIGLASEAESLRRAAAVRYPFDFYTFLLYSDGGESPYGEGTSRKTARLFSPRPWSDEVAKAASKTGTSDRMIWALMKRESKFQADAVSRNGAVGLMQLMPKTAAEEARQLHIKAANLYDPTLNILLGAKHFAILSRRYAGELPRAIAAYNAGSASVNRWNTLTAMDWAEWIEEIPYPETREFVRSVLENAETYRLAYGKAGESPLLQTAGERPSAIPVAARRH